ncbi:MAG: UbiD family decarboxylase, partial [Candidatus Bathyarchaeota archaeon]|nr:UbiD family decarboxylase [Candidatus Bathyarchaeota archaeon]
MRNFIRELEADGELVRIGEPLSTRHEIPAVMREFDAGKAIVFEDVEGHDAKVVAGVCGTRDRILRALGVDAEDLYGHLMDAVRNPTPC